MPYPVETEIIANVVTSPHHLSATMVTGREHRMTEVFARLAPGATLDAARAELRTVHAAMVAAHPEVYKPGDHYTIDVTRMHDQINSRANTILWVLFAASTLLFVIACSNVANLVLARTARRESELAVRSALGATTAALRRSLLAESLVLSGSGALAGLLIAAPMVAVLGRYASRFSARADGLTLDFSLVWIGIALALIAAVFLAFVPRLPSADSSQGLGLTSSGTRVTGGSSRRLRLFAVTQITASFLLLAGAGALIKTLFALERTQPPFDTARVLAVNLPVMSYGRTPEQVASVLSRRAAPGQCPARRGTRVLRFRRSLARRQGTEHQLHLRHGRRSPSERPGRLARTLPFHLSRIFRDPGRTHSPGPRLSETPTATAPSAS